MDETKGRSARKLLVYGRSGPWSLEASYARAFRRLGWQVELVDSDPTGEDLAWWVRSRLGRRLSRYSLSARRQASHRRNERLLDRARECHPDLLLVFKGSFLMPETVRALREAGIPVAVFNPDNPFPGHAAYRPEHLPVMGAADLAFIWSRSLAERLEQERAGRVSYLPFAWDPTVFPYVEDAQGEGPEVVFVGGWDRRRERWLEAVARQFELEIWGPDYWESRTRRGSPLRPCWRGRALRGPEAARVLARAKIALNVVREQNMPDGTNMRTFEVPGAGGFLLATRTGGATQIYPEGEAGAFFGAMEEMLEKIEHFLALPEERRAVARRAHEVTARENRYVHRARSILSFLEGAFG